MEGLYYVGKYAPVVSWTTVKLMMSLSTNQGWDTIQVDFSYAFVQDTLVDDIYLYLTSYFDSDTDEDRAKMVMNINKSLYGLVQEPFYRYNHLEGVFESRGFKPRPLDTCMFYGRGMIELIYDDGVLFFGTNQDNIDEFIKELEYDGLSLTIKEDVYDFLVVEVKTDKK